MIRIIKGAVPEILQTKGQEEIDAMCKAYLLDPPAYSREKEPLSFEFKSEIYGHTTVKEALKLDQHNKCCFCENQNFDDISHGDVEHFRPKAGYRTSAREPLIKPGYYWLAYDWTNLYYSCQICNQIYKKNLFPLADEIHRSKNHTITAELPDHTLVVHPSHDDPETHIGYRKEVAFGKTPKGARSIAVFGLQRSKLSEKRLRYLDEVKKNIVLAQFDFADITPAKKGLILQVLATDDESKIEDVLLAAKTFIAVAAKAEAPFSNMIRCNFAALPR